jgi:hypothetical protein|nr:MAG TPA: hypothetical protein [Caudoviricetes sp.]
MSLDEIRLYLPHEVLAGLPFFRSKPMHFGNTNILRDMVTEVLGDFGFNIEGMSIDINKYLGVTKYDIDRLSNVCIYGSDIIFNALQEFRYHLNGSKVEISVELRADKKYSVIDNVILIKRIAKQ